MSTYSEFLPNLPGFKPHDVRRGGARVSYFKKINGQVFVKDTSHEFDINEMGASASIASLGTSSSPVRSRAQTANPDRNVLVFQSQFQDHEKQNYTRRVTIYYYCEDSSIKVVEIPKTNSGIPQGTILRRMVLLKSDGTNYTPYDFVLGEEIDINKTWYLITDCSSSTRNYYSNIGLDFPEADASHSEHVKLPKWSDNRPKKSDLKKFMEARLGNTVSNAGRSGFIVYGNTTLKFLCSWDDSDNLYGERNEYSLVYHLADDTIEIFTSGGKDLFPKLLRRAPLPKSCEVQTVGSGEVSEAMKDTYHWRDFYIGAELSVYHRRLIVLDADANTRQFYQNQGMELDEGISIMDAKPISYEREIPPHTGFGSEEDSLKSCVGPLCPGVTQVRKTSLESRTLSFSACLENEQNMELARRFIITYYLQDDTLKIQEPPVRNSGYAGGQFLSRRKVKCPDGEVMGPRHFKIGQTIQILTHRFILTGSNQWTSDYLAGL